MVSVLSRMLASSTPSDGDSSTTNSSAQQTRRVTSTTTATRKCTVSLNGRATTTAISDNAWTAMSTATWAVGAADISAMASAVTRICTGRTNQKRRCDGLYWTTNVPTNTRVRGSFTFDVRSASAPPTKMIRKNTRIASTATAVDASVAFAAGTTREEDVVVGVVVGFGVEADAWRKTWNTAELETA